MTLDDWRAITYMTADINAYCLFAVTVVCLFNFTGLKRRMKLIGGYLFVCTGLEIVLGLFVKLEKPQLYFSFVNHFYVLFEAVLIGLFLFNTLKLKFTKRIVFAGIAIVLAFQIWSFIVFPDIDSRYGSALLASIFSILILFSLFDQSQQPYRGKFYLVPEVVVFIDFLVAYLSLLIIFWFLPSAIEYSRILANLLLILKNLIGILFYLVLIYLFWRNPLTTNRL